MKSNSNASIAIVPDRDVLQSILDTLQPVNFREIAGLPEGGNLNQRQLIVLCVNTVIDTARDLGFDLRKTEGTAYFFNEQYWQDLEAERLERFLGEAAEIMGIDSLTAQHFNFREQLIKQFGAKAGMVPPKPSTDRVLINLQNGTLEIDGSKVRLRNFRADDFIRYQLPFAFSENATCPKWQRFLNRVLPDPQSQAVLGEFFASIFTDLKLEKALMAHGTGANGKSVVFEVINSLLGETNVSSYSLTSLNNDYQRAMLRGKLLNYCSELDGRLNPDIFKKLVSGEPIEARLPYEKPFIMRRYARLAFNCNELPWNVEHNEAFFRRLLIIPFDVTIPKEERNPELASEIIAEELPGILNWALLGLTRLRTQNGFSECAASEGILERYKMESDSVSMFVDSAGYEVATDGQATDLAVIYAEYREYCKDNGCVPLSTVRFRPRLERLGLRTTRRGQGRVVFVKKTSSHPTQADLESRPIFVKPSNDPSLNAEEAKGHAYKREIGVLTLEERQAIPYTEEWLAVHLPRKKLGFADHAEMRGFNTLAYEAFRNAWLKLAEKNNNQAAIQAVLDYESQQKGFTTLH